MLYNINVSFLSFHLDSKLTYQTNIPTLNLYFIF